MTTASPIQLNGVATISKPPRIASIDIFRGLTMLVMIFVNDLASVHGLPWWTYHMKANIDAMTYVDMVFPFFLFIVGLSIPLAIRARLKKNESMPALWMHVLLRSFSLVVMGLIIANAERGDSARMGINTDLWGLLALAGAVLFWMVYTGSERHATLLRVLRYVGLGLMVVMFAIFRRTTHSGHVAWIEGSYPEILGLIGCTYLVVCILYIPTRRWLWAPFAWFLALLAVSAVATAREIGFPHTHHLWPFTTGAMPCVCMAGVATSAIFLGAHRWQLPRQKMLLAFVFAIFTLVAGWFLTPLGISKIRATPTWCLYSAGAAILLFILLYWICDVKKQTAWAFFARPAGSNTLLTYLLPDFYYFLLGWIGVSYFDTHFAFGWPGVMRSVIFTAFILVLAGILTRLKIRMQL
ncbi:MAG TPA: DUF5009 domain-containing protein [Acidobacteriaceae bacterium]|jgi:predicted acyltransferase|nr:DUF5009 domain-containing protein [Acidobacteriaceae bacterium]